MNADQHYERRFLRYVVTTDPAALDIDAVERFLRRSYWAANRSRERIERGVLNSLCFCVLEGRQQVGFARVVTDYSDFAWLCDVFIDEEHRGNGLGLFLMQAVLEHPRLQGLRRWILATSSAHGLYEKLGFRPLAHPDNWMERRAAPGSA